MLVVIVGFVIFNGNGMGGAMLDLAGMFGLRGLPLSSIEAVYYLRSYGLTIAIAALGSTPIPARAYGWLRERTGGRAEWAEPVALAALFLCCTAYLVDGSFNPFLYFRF